MSGQDIRRAFMRRFTGFQKQSSPRAYAIVAAYVAQVAAAIALGSWLLRFPPSVSQGLLVALLAFFVGTRLRGFNNITHECSHASFAARREDNAILGRVCSAVVFGCFRAYRDDHMTHHAHLGDYAEDRDLAGIRALRLEAPLTARTVARHVLTPLLGLHLPWYLRLDLGAGDGRGWQAVKLGLVAAGVALAAVAPWTALWLVAVPWLWVFPAINYWTDCVDHGGLLENADELRASRNMPLPVSLRVLLFPRNDCFHLVHHLFPQVPAQHLESCHEVLMHNAAYRDAAARGLQPASSIHAVPAE